MVAIGAHAVAGSGKLPGLTDVCVIGAGLAGLVAGARLREAGASVCILEARDRVGGRLLSEPVGERPDQVVELGGQWAGPTQHRVLALADRLGVATFRSHTAGENLLERDGRLHRYRGTIPRLGPGVLADIAQAQWRIDGMAARVDPEAPWLAPRAERWDAQTVATWIRRNVRTRAGRDLLALGVEAVWAADPADVSLLHFLFYIRSAGGFDALLATEGGAQERRFVGGSQRLATELAAGQPVRHGAVVRRIEHGPEGVTVHHGSEIAEARRAIVCLPPALAGRIDYDPPLPAVRDALTQRMAQGRVIKCMAVYPEPFWRDAGLSGHATSTTGPVKLTYDNSPPDGSPGVLLGFLEGRQARVWGGASPQARRDAVLGTFARLFGPRARTPERFLERAWADDPFARGCYGGYLPPGGWLDCGRALRAPVGRLHWAGAETAVVWNGYMDGAVSSGERAAAEVLVALG